MNPPAIESAVQTTPPMIRAETMPAGPLRPTATRMIEARINVIRVIPETGLVPTIAMALAATVVNRNAITPTKRRPMMAWNQLWSTPNWKKRKVTMRVAAMPIMMIFIDRSLWVRTAVVALEPSLPLSSLAASPTAPRMMSHDLMMPMMPAVAMPPIPIWRA